MEESREHGEFGVKDFERNETREIKTKYYVLLIVESLGLGLAIVYLILSNFNRKTFKETFVNSDKIIIYVLSAVIIASVLTVLEFSIVKNKKIEEASETQKETTKSDVSVGQVVSDEVISLNEYDSNITLKDAKEYTLTGEFNHSIIIDSNEEVILNLENVKINSNLTAAIVNKNNTKLTINLVDGSENTLKDGGSSEYDAAVYSVGALTINGSGVLNVYGCQVEGEGIATETNDIVINGGNIYIESNDDGINAGKDGGTIIINGGNVTIKASGDGIDSNKDLVINGGVIFTAGSSLGGDAGIDTDEGFQINGGFVIALGSDMLESPLKSSKQNFVTFNLKNKIMENELVTLLDENNNVIVSFKALVDFKTLIISTEEMSDKTYYLYQGGENKGTIKNGIYSQSNYVLGTKIAES